MSVSEPGEPAAAVARITERAAAARLDLIAPLAITGDDAPLPTFGRAAALGVVVGNTRAFWPRVLAALAADASLAVDPDPIDRYTERALAAIAPPGSEVFFAHVRTDHGWLPIQRFA